MSKINDKSFKEFQIDVFRTSANANDLGVGVRVIHKPTSISYTSTEYSTVRQNLAEAFANCSIQVISKLEAENDKQDKQIRVLLRNISYALNQESLTYGMQEDRARASRERKVFGLLKDAITEFELLE